MIPRNKSAPRTEAHTSLIFIKEKQTMKTSISTRRLLSLFAALALVVMVLLTVQARITASNVVSSPQAAVDQAVARDPRYNSSSPQAAVDQAGSTSSQPYYRSVVPSRRLADGADFGLCARGSVVSHAANLSRSPSITLMRAAKTAIDVTKDASQALQERWTSSIWCYNRSASFRRLRIVTGRL